MNSIFQTIIETTIETPVETLIETIHDTNIETTIETTHLPFLRTRDNVMFTSIKLTLKGPQMGVYFIIRLCNEGITLLFVTISGMNPHRSSLLTVFHE